MIEGEGENDEGHRIGGDAIATLDRRRRGWRSAREGRAGRARSIAERRAPQTTTTEATSARASERIDPTRARVSDRSVRRGEASEERTREGIESRIDRSERRSTTRDVRFARVERWRSR